MKFTLKTKRNYCTLKIQGLQKSDIMKAITLLRNRIPKGKARSRKFLF